MKMITSDDEDQDNGQIVRFTCQVAILNDDEEVFIDSNCSLCYEKYTEFKGG